MKQEFLKLLNDYQKNPSRTLIEWQKQINHILEKLTNGDYVTTTAVNVLLTDFANYYPTNNAESAFALLGAIVFAAGPLTANRLLATNGAGAMVSVANLASWIAGTAGQITVADDGDGTITLSIANPTITTFTDTGTLTPAQKGLVICNKATAMTLNLPTITGNLALNYSIINIGVGTVTLDPNGVETFVGDATFDLYTDESINIFASSTEWREGGR